MENSKISWCDHTFNPWIGCTKVSEGCKHCYAETLMDKRWGKVKWGPEGARVRTSEAYWKKPEKWNREAEWFVECVKCGWRGSKLHRGACPNCGGGECKPARQRVFCGSLCDVFEDRQEEAPIQFDLWDLIRLTPNLDWLLLTKRPELAISVLPLMYYMHWPDNVWVGTSVENQEQADKRIPELLHIPARVRFLSVEPMLGPIDLRLHDYAASGNSHSVRRTFIHWVIVGGESGPEARPMHPEWVRSIRDQCQAAGVPFFFKQWGEWIPRIELLPQHQVANPGEWGIVNIHGKYLSKTTTWNGRQNNPDDEYETTVYRIGKKLAGCMLDGVEYKEWPK